MFTTVPHTNEKYKNQTLLWHGYDSEDQFESNLAKNNPKQLQWMYPSDQIDYKFNSYGFRSDEFSQTDNLMTLGCSFTFGTAIAQCSRWSSIISKTLGLADFNLGIDGASADCCFRMAENWIPQLKPKIVLYQSPDASRFEWFDDKNVKPHNMLVSSENHSEFYKQWILNENNLKYNHLKNLYAIQHLAESHGAKFIHISIDKISRLDYARDLGHYGPKTHYYIAKNILDWPKR